MRVFIITLVRPFLADDPADAMIIHEDKRTWPSRPSTLFLMLMSIVRMLHAGNLPFFRKCPGACPINNEKALYDAIL